jgi:hypothetical protein
MQIGVDSFAASISDPIEILETRVAPILRRELAASPTH